MYTNISQWLVEWYKLSDRIFPLDKWELEYVRDGIWDEWMLANEHIEKAEEILVKEREILDTLLLTTIEWAEKKAKRFSEEEAIKFIMIVKSKKQTEQHTQQWHAEKSKLLTASEFGSILGGVESAVRRNVFVRKFEKKTESGVFLGEVSSPTGDSTPVGVSNENLLLPATVWGHRFEPVARLLASKMFFEGGEILDNIGRIVHETYKNLAASPDGLITEGPFKGNLIEIKCPITRFPIQDEIPSDYYCQMQIQMEVLNCPTVEFVEMKFKQYKDLPEKTSDWCGVLAVILNGSALRYEYGPFNAGYSSKLTKWTPTLQEEDQLVEKTFWILENSHWKTVRRNTFWWSEIGFPAYEKFWSEFDTRYEEWISKKSNWLFSED